MKKYLFLLLPVMAILLMPTGVSAKSKCEVVSGNGRNVGDEIACGTEHFYVLDNDGENIKMLAKYNLYTGVKIDKVKIEREAGDTTSDEFYCGNLASQRNAVSRRDGVYNVPGYCFMETRIMANEIKQNSEAISAHWDEAGNYIYPQVGDVYLRVESGYYYNNGSTAGILGRHDLSQDYPSAEKYDNYFYDYKDHDSYMIQRQNYAYNTYQSDLLDTLTSYKDTLEANDYEVKTIVLITLDDINSVVKKNNKTIPYSEWKSAALSNRMNSDRLEFAFLDDYLTDKQKFLYNTTYWIRTGYNTGYGYTHGTDTNGASTEYVLFVDSNGGVCESGYVRNGSTVICGSTFNNYISKIGCGIRPMVVIANDLKYKITTKTDGNGKIEVEDTASGNDEVKFKIIPNKGFTLKSLRVITDSGEEVDFSEEELIKNEDGTVSFSDNKFTMPFDNVTIEASWEKIGTPVSVENPNTAAATPALFFVLFGALSAAIGVVVKKRLG